MANFELTARVIPEPIASVTATTKYLELVVCWPDGTRMTDVPRRSQVSAYEPLNTPGTGQFAIARSDELFDHYPNLLDYDNIVQFWLGGKCVSGFRIKEKTLTLVGDAEEVARGTLVSGPTVHQMFQDFIVKHDGLPRPDSGNTRAFNWTARRGEWWNSADWDHVVRSWTGQNPPTPQKRHNPKHWRVPSARWIGFRGEWKYLRHDFHIPDGGMHIRMMGSADENFKVYLDGDEVLGDQHHEIGYKSYVHYDTFIRGGRHTVAIRTRAKPSKNGDGWDNVRFAIVRVNHRGRIILPPILVSDSSWEAHKGPPPAWNRAQVLRTLVQEGAARSVASAMDLTLGFTGDEDSGGHPWVDRWNKPLDIGTTTLDAQAQLSESGNFDVWVDPENLTVKAWNFRGINRAASIALVPGVNLLDYQVTETDEVLNQALVQYDGGWVNTKLESSIEKYHKRETYAELGDIKDPETARLVMNQALRGIGRPSNSSGTPEIKHRPEGVPAGSIIPAEGMFPMVDFETGDLITAYNASADPVPHRVMSLTLTEGDNHELSFDGEFSVIDGSA